jgi:ATP-binding cassette subfamily C protein LapB
MDEPTSAMDINGEKILIDKLKRQLITQTIVMITHRASIIDLVDRVIVIDGGKVVAQGPKSDFMKPQNPAPTAQAAPAQPQPAEPAATAQGPVATEDQAATTQEAPVETASGFAGVTVMKPGTRKRKTS